MLLRQWISPLLVSWKKHPALNENRSFLLTSGFSQMIYFSASRHLRSISLATAALRSMHSMMFTGVLSMVSNDELAIQQRPLKKM